MSDMLTKHFVLQDEYCTKADQKQFVLYSIALVRLQNIRVRIYVPYVYRCHLPLEWCGGWEKLLNFLAISPKWEVVREFSL